MVSLQNLQNMYKQRLFKNTIEVITMLVKEKSIELKAEVLETLESFIANDNNYAISKKAFYTGFQHRSKVEFLRFFIV